MVYRSTLSLEEFKAERPIKDEESEESEIGQMGVLQVIDRLEVAVDSLLSRYMQLLSPSHKYWYRTEKLLLISLATLQYHSCKDGDIAYSTVKCLPA